MNFKNSKKFQKIQNKIFFQKFISRKLLVLERSGLHHRIENIQKFLPYKFRLRAHRGGARAQLLSTFLSISNFWVGRAGLQNTIYKILYCIGQSITNFLDFMRGRTSNLHTKFQPNCTNIAKVIPFSNFYGGRLVGPVRMNRF